MPPLLSLRKFEIPVRFDGAVLIHAESYEMAKLVACLGLKMSHGYNPDWRRQIRRNALPKYISLDAVDSRLAGQHESYTQIFGLSCVPEDKQVLVLPSALRDSGHVQFIGVPEIPRAIVEKIVVVTVQDTSYVFCIEAEGWVQLDAIIEKLRAGLAQALRECKVESFLLSLQTNDVQVRAVHNAIFTEA